MGGAVVYGAEEHSSLVAYEQRCEARPAFARALDAQLAVFAS